MLYNKNQRLAQAVTGQSRVNSIASRLMSGEPFSIRNDRMRMTYRFIKESESCYAFQVNGVSMGYVNRSAFMVLGFVVPVWAFGDFKNYSVFYESVDFKGKEAVNA